MGLGTTWKDFSKSSLFHGSKVHGQLLLGLRKTNKLNNEGVVVDERAD